LEGENNLEEEENNLEEEENNLEGEEEENNLVSMTQKSFNNQETYDQTKLNLRKLVCLIRLFAETNKQSY
jgi:hypothetical protein